MTRGVSPESEESGDRTATKPSELSLSHSANGAATLAALFEDHSSELAGYLRKTFGNGPPDPEDVAQEAFSRLAERSDLSSIKNLKAYLWRTARTLTLTERRNSGIRSKYDVAVKHLYFALEGTESDPERVLGAQEQLKLISAVLEKMPERRRQAFLLHRIENLNLAAVGRRLGVTRGAAVKHVTRAVVDIDAALARQRESSD